MDFVIMTMLQQSYIIKYLINVCLPSFWVFPQPLQ